MRTTGPGKHEPFIVALHKAVFGVDKAVDRMLDARFALTFSQFFILRILAKRPGTTQREIADARGLTEAAVSRSAELLAKKRLITRVVNPSSRRERVLTLTRKGRAVEARARLAALGMVGRALDGFTAAERRTLDRAIGRLASAFCDGTGACAEEK